MAGRPEVNIDWVKVDALLRNGCNGAGVAAELGVHYDTLVKRAAREGIIGEDTPYANFSEYLQAKKARLCNVLRMAQVKSALGEKEVVTDPLTGEPVTDARGKKIMGVTREPNITMQIWLGKQMLDQTDRRNIKHEGERSVTTVNITPPKSEVEPDPVDEDEE